MTEAELNSVKRYLRNLTFIDKEFYEEMYDHICSSYENRVDPSQTFKEHIREEIEPAFGGKLGMRKVQRTQAAIRKKMVYQRALDLYKAYFSKWPSILITAGVFGLLFAFHFYLAVPNLFFNSLIVGLFVPYAICRFGKWRFKQECRQLRLPYAKSQVNETIQKIGFTGGLIFFAAYTLISWFAIEQFDGILQFFDQTPFIFIPMSLFIIVYALVCLQLFKENFQLKLA